MNWYIECQSGDVIEIQDESGYCIATMGDGNHRVENAQLMIEAPRLLEACEATLLFFSGSPWDDAKALRWFNITQDPDCTSKKLCDHIRKIMTRATGKGQHHA